MITIFIEIKKDLRKMVKPTEVLNYLVNNNLDFIKDKVTKMSSEEVIKYLKLTIKGLVIPNA